MKKAVNSIFVMAVLLLATACSSTSTGRIRIGETAASKIAKDTQIPGKGVSGQCLPFAQALHQKFEAAGIPSRVIVYGYDVSPVPQKELPELGRSGDRQAHAVVTYDDGGRTYVMDNQSWSPQWVHDAAPIQMAQQFSGINCQVRIARVVSDPTPPISPVAPLSGSVLAVR
jgi:hypothetical protein